MSSRPRLIRLTYYYVVLAITCQFYVVFQGLLFIRSAAAKDLEHDGHLRLFTSHQQEYLEIQYEDSAGNINPQAMQRLSHFLRSREDDQVMSMNPEVIRLMDHLQDHFHADSIEIICGYRSPKFNAQLKHTGHAVASESYHMKGMAIDLHLDEVDEADLRDYALTLGLGGVGYYGNKLFVHVDVGPVRRWDAGSFKNNTEIGIFNKINTWKIRTDRLVYESRGRVQVTVSPLVPEEAHIELQKFWRGDWRSLINVPRQKTTLTTDGFSLMPLSEILPKDPPLWGKYRLHFTSGNDWQNSNEFYIRSRQR